MEPSDPITSEELIDVEPAGGPMRASADDRRTMPEPPPVRLVAVADVRLPMTAGLEAQLDAFYVRLFGFEREGAPHPKPRLTEPLLGGNRDPITAPPVALGLRNEQEDHPSLRAAAASAASDNSIRGPIYQAENFRLVFDVLERKISRDDLRPTGIEVPSLADMEARLIEAEVEYSRQRGLQPGQETFVLLDPTGNWIEISEMKRF